MIRKHLGRIAAIVLLLAVGRASAADAPATPSLDLTPSDISADAFPDHHAVSLDVRLKAGGQPLSNVQLTTFSNDKVTVETPETQLVAPTIAAGAEQTWRLRLSHPRGLVATAKLYIRAAFDVPGAGGAPVRQYLYATANLSPLAAVNSSAPAKAEILGDAVAVTHERPGQLLLQITNQDARDLTIVSVAFLKPDFVTAGYCPPAVTDATLCLPRADAPSSPAPAPGIPADRFSVVDLSAAHLPALPPGQASIIPFAVGAEASVVPGKYTIAARIMVRSDDMPGQTVLSSHEVDVEVLGESELTKLVGVPSLLFLPGVIAIVTWQLLWSFGKTSDERAKFPLQPTSSPFWLSAIALSLVGAWLYPPTTAWLLRERRNYLVSYGVKDFAIVFGLSIAAAIMAYLGSAAIAWLGRRFQAYRLAQSTPQTGDLPQQILEKLAAVGHEASGRAVYPVGGNQAAAMLVLEPWSDDTTLWLAPPARLTLVIGQNHPDYYQALDEQDELVTGQVTEPDAVATQVRLGVENGWWTIRWETIGAIEHPVSAKPAAWADLPRRARLIR